MKEGEVEGVIGGEGNRGVIGVLGGGGGAKLGVVREMRF